MNDTALATGPVDVDYRNLEAPLYRWPATPKSKLTISGAEASLPEHIAEFQQTLRDFAINVVRPIGIELPNFVELQIVDTEPAVRGDTVSGATKPATLATGFVLNVPLFLSSEEWIVVDTRTGEYVERVKK